MKNGRIKTLFELLLFLAFVFLGNGIGAQTIETVSPGSYIIDMGVSPQTIDNALKPYGLVYELAKEHFVPVRWIINNSKLKDGTDFTYNGTDYKGGPFIIPAEYRTTAVNSVISAWEGEGVIGTTTSSSIDVPVYQIIDYFVIWTLDSDNGDIAEEYLENANIPATAYNFSDPQDLTCCNDLYVMPHADPVWDTHSNLYDWNRDCKGGIWAACHAVSALENTFNPAVPTEQMNFLSEKIATASGTDDWADNSLILWGDHDDGTIPYEYAFPAHPVMQFLGMIDEATQNGSEQVYLPHLQWRNSTNIGTWDSDHPDLTSPDQVAAIIAFGQAFGDSDRGKVMYEAGHTHSKKDDPDNIAAQRAFFNFSFWTAADNSIKITTNIPVTGTVNEPISLEAIAVDGAGTYSFEWTADCPGTFDDEFTASTSFTPSNPGACVIQVRVSDNCGRTSFQSKELIVNLPPANTTTATDDINQTLVDTPVGGQVLTNDDDAEGDIQTVNSVPVSNPGNGTVVLNTDGTYVYTPNVGYVGEDNFEYEVCDDGMPQTCDTAIVTITIQENTDPTINEVTGQEDTATTETDTPVSACLVCNDSDPEEDNLSVNTNPVTGPTNGMLVINPDGTYTYTPDPGYEGEDTFQYEVCDDGAPQACEVVDVYISIIPDTPDNKTFANDDAATGQFNTPINDEVLGNDTDPEAHSQTVTTTPVINPANGTVVLNTNGTYTYTPNPGYTGPDQFVYEVCDDGTPQACDEATVYLTILPSVECDLSSVNVSLEACNDNGTNTAVGDDYITFSLNPTGTNLSGTYSVAANTGAVVSLVAGGVGTEANYGSSTAFRLQDGSADGTNYTITVTDSGDPTCTLSTIITEESCSAQICPGLTFANSSISICQGTVISELVVNTDASEDIDFVYFNSAQTAAAVYASGTLIGTSTPSEGTAVLTNITDFTNTGSYYIYARLATLHSDPTCRPIAELTLTVTSGPDTDLLVSDERYCLGEERFVTVTSSDPGYSYNLLDESNNSVGSSVIGTGAAIQFPLPELIAGSYTFSITVSNGTYCTFTLADMANITVTKCDDTDIRFGCSEPLCHEVPDTPLIYLGSGVATSEVEVPDNGVTFPNDIYPNSTIRIPVNFYNNTGNPIYIQAWVDWDGNNELEAFEQVIASTEAYDALNLTQTILYPLIVPPNALQGQPIVSLFRISTDPIIVNNPCGSVGCATDGESEIFRLTVACPQSLCFPVQTVVRRN